jgi:hypothetical protein
VVPKVEGRVYEESDVGVGDIIGVGVAGCAFVNQEAIVKK